LAMSSGSASTPHSLKDKKVIGSLVRRKKCSGFSA
jgi:hypothetical protein